MKKDHPLFTELKEQSKKIHTYGSILSLLHWDQETYMPPGGISARSGQIALLSGRIHEEKTNPKFRSRLIKLIHLSSGKPRVKRLSKAELICLREWRKNFLRDTKLPCRFIEELSQVTSEATQIWAIAKKDNNFKLFAPFLQKIVDLNRKKADILGFTGHPYDPLLESHEPCMNTQRLGTLFTNLQQQITPLLKKISSSNHIDDRFLHKVVGQDKQLELARFVLSKLPVDPSYFRFDLSNHPFSTGIHAHDARITTRILPKAFMSNIFSLLHEAGHMMYDMGLPAEHWGTPLAEPVSLSIHESQSRWWETLIGRNRPFWRAYYSSFQSIYTPLKNISLEEFYRAINKVNPSYIRVEADEVTYCLHVILRFEIEKQLIAGTLPVTEIPELWNSKMQELLGIKPRTDTEGCLQDVHWSLGEFGYFPTYALGNIFAAQFFSAFAEEHKDWSDKITQGDLAFVREWLKRNVHSWGKTYTSEELVKKATKQSLSIDAYSTYLKKKYTEIYA
ncbi:MAG: carboxypeptidase M32 [Chlamydiales bacterium]|nr:carboxypeptidase M32 [Chlamydiales bacterium]